MRRHHYPGHFKMLRHIDGVQRPRAAECDEREVARIESAIHGEQTRCIGHVGRGRVEDRERGLLDR
jgi:hypothetical protein